MANLRMISTLKARYPDLIIGYSGHEKSGIVVSLGALALGAKVIERHFTLDRHMKGTDHIASLEPQGLQQLIGDIRKMESALGDGVKRIYDEELPIRRKLGKSVTAKRDMSKGTVLTKDELTMKSPGTGLPGYELDHFVGRVAQADIAKDYQFSVDELDWPKKA
jgi:sialic acid synthase SpsE